MSSSRFTLALSAGKLVITNREKVSVALEIRNTNDATGVVHTEIKHIRAGQTLDLTRYATIKDLRKSVLLKQTISRRRIYVHNTWNEKK